MALRLVDMLDGCGENVKGRAELLLDARSLKFQAGYINPVENM